MDIITSQRIADYLDSQELDEEQEELYCADEISPAERYACDLYNERYVMPMSD